MTGGEAQWGDTPPPQWRPIGDKILQWEGGHVPLVSPWFFCLCNCISGIVDTRLLKCTIAWARYLTF